MPPIAASSGAAAARPPAGPPTEPVDGNFARIEREVLVELNAVRTDPTGYAMYLNQLLPMFDGMLLRRPGRVAVRTQEGAAAVREAIDALKRQSPLPALTGSSAIAATVGTSSTPPRASSASRAARIRAMDQSA